MLVKSYQLFEQCYFNVIILIFNFLYLSYFFSVYVFTS